MGALERASLRTSVWSLKPPSAHRDAVAVVGPGPLV